MNDCVKEVKMKLIENFSTSSTQESWVLKSDYGIEKHIKERLLFNITNRIKETLEKNKGKIILFKFGEVTKNMISDRYSIVEFKQEVRIYEVIEEEK